MTTLNDKPTPESAQPVSKMIPDQIDKAVKITHEATHSVAVSAETEPIPDWLLEFVLAAKPVITPIQPEFTPVFSVPYPLISDQERFVASQMNTPVEVDTTSPVIEPEPAFHPKSIWEEEDAVELGLTNPDQTFFNPIDELKILLDEDPQETVAFIRGHMHDADFRAGAVRNLRAYLTLEPDSDVLWQIFEELQHTDPIQEA